LPGGGRPGACVKGRGGSNKGGSKKKGGALFGEKKNPNRKCEREKATATPLGEQKKKKTTSKKESVTEKLFGPEKFKDSRIVRPEGIRTLLKEKVGR